MLGQLGEGVAREAVGAYDDGLAEELGELQLGDHVILREHPLAVVELLELLLYAHILHKVDRGLLGQRQLAAAHVVAGVLQDVEVAPESKVHLVVGQEVEVDA